MFGSETIQTTFVFAERRPVSDATACSSTVLAGIKGSLAAWSLVKPDPQHP